MTTFLPQNQFLPNSAPARTSPGAGDAAAMRPPPVPAAADFPNPTMPTVGSAVPFDLPPVIGGTAAPGVPSYSGSISPDCHIRAPDRERTPPIDEPSMTNGGAWEAPAAAAPVRDTTAGATDCISEIFHYARKLMRGHQGFVLDEGAFMAAIDEEPLFLREDGYLRRNA